MNATVRELIIDNLYKSLASIAQVSGYANDATAKLDSMRGSYAVDRQLRLLDEGDTPQDDSPQNKDDYNANFRVVSLVATSDNASPDASISVERSRLVADVRKALMQDYSRGGWAINTTVGENSILDTTETAGYSGDVIFVTVHYRTQRDDPYSL